MKQNVSLIHLEQPALRPNVGHYRHRWVLLPPVGHFRAPVGTTKVNGLGVLRLPMVHYRAPVEFSLVEFCW